MTHNRVLTRMSSAIRL